MDNSYRAQPLCLAKSPMNFTRADATMGVIAGFGSAYPGPKANLLHEGIINITDEYIMCRYQSVLEV